MISISVKIIVIIIFAIIEQPQFTDSETKKDCVLAVMDEVINDNKIKTSVTSAILTKFKSETMNENCLFFIIFIWFHFSFGLKCVITCCLLVTENVWPH